jgi:hypothetical protein
MSRYAARRGLTANSVIAVREREVAVEGCAVAEYEMVWRERIEPLHDLILEALLDNVEAAAVFGQTANTGR